MKTATQNNNRPGRFKDEQARYNAMVAAGRSPYQKILPEKIIEDLYNQLAPILRRRKGKSKPRQRTIKLMTGDKIIVYYRDNRVIGVKAGLLTFNSLQQWVVDWLWIKYPVSGISRYTSASAQDKWQVLYKTRYRRQQHGGYRHNYHAAVKRLARCLISHPDADCQRGFDLYQVYGVLINKLTRNFGEDPYLI